MIIETHITSEISETWTRAFSESLIQTPFISEAWHRLYFSTAGKAENLFIMHIPELDIIAPFSKNESVLSFIGEEITDYSDIIGIEGNKFPAWNQILDYCKQNGISKISLTNIPETSQTLSYFQQTTIKNGIASITKRDTSPKMLLPQSYDLYLSDLTKKHRHELKRKIRKFNDDYSSGEIRQSTDLERDMDTLINLMKLDERKKTFFTNEQESFFRSLPGYFPKELMLYILYIDETPATAILAFSTATSFLLFNSGFDQLRFPGAGFYLKAESIRIAIEKGYKEYNFLRGNERYKYELGGKDFGVFDILIQII